MEKASKYDSLIDLAFNDDFNVRYNNTIERARHIGMDEKKIQELVDLGDDYFLK